MSDYFDLFLSMELRADLSDDVLHEIRWHLGLIDTPPAQSQAVEPDSYYRERRYPLFTGIGESHAFDGADVAALVRAEHRAYPDGGVRWLVTVRSCVHEDEYGTAIDFATWLAGHATTRGWIGYLRYTSDDETRNLTYDGTDIHGL